MKDQFGKPVKQGKRVVPDSAYGYGGEPLDLTSDNEDHLSRELEIHMRALKDAQTNVDTGPDMFRIDSLKRTIAEIKSRRSALRTRRGSKGDLVDNSP